MDQRFPDYHARVERILDLFDDRYRISRDRTEEAQSMFRVLKEDLQAEYKSMDTGTGQARLSAAERVFYHPAICDAWANTGVSSVRWDSRPDRRWHDALWSVGDYMKHWQSSLA